MPPKPLLTLLLLATLAPPLARAADQPAPFRRSLTFKPAPSDAPGDPIAWSEFYANGSQKTDASDLRVSTPAGLIVPSKILQSSPTNDLIRIAFLARADGPYHVSWGNPNAEKSPAPKELDISRGVLVDIFQSPGGAVRDDASIEQLFSRSAHIGALFQPAIFLGYNPLGPERFAMLHYTAQFKIDSPIKPDIAFTVQDAGQLKIDGKLIASQFRGGLRGRVRDSQSLDLTPGWHSIDVTQIDQGNPTTGVSVAWRRPGEKGFTPLPPNIFAPVSPATAGPLEKAGALAPDFTITPEAEAFIPPESFIPRYSFEAQLPENVATPAITWDFGDGQTLSAQRKVNHFFLSPGTYAVTMTIKLGAASSAATRRIAIQDRLYSRYPKPPQDNERIVQTVLKDYDLHKLSGAQALQGMLFFKDQSDADDQTKWGLAWLQSKDPAPSDKTLNDESIDLARQLESKKDYRAAAEILRLASEKQAGILTRLDLLRQHVMTLCDDLDEAPAALAETQDWQKKINPANKEQARRLQGATLYAAIANADTKLAQATANQIGITKGPNYNDAEIRQGVLARNIESYIRTSDFDTARTLLDQWELEYPAAIWDGFTRTLRVKLLAAQSRPQLAAKVALAHAQANPTGFYAAELLYRASENFKAANQPTQSKAALDLLTTKYPESPYARGTPNPE